MKYFLERPSFPALCQGLSHLFFPNLCAACGDDVPALQDCFCLRCRHKLESTKNMHLEAENEFTGRFWGRLRLESGTALYYFTRKSPIQHALHQLKYRNQPDIGRRLGAELGRRLRQSPLFRGVEAVIPVPLHPKKEKLRGYNQSALFAQGISAELGVPALNQVLLRRMHSASQTRKKRLERFQNVGEVFALHRPEAIAGKHILLVDDVLTTGATLETCGNVLLQAPDVRLSLATIGIALGHHP